MINSLRKENASWRSRVRQVLDGSDTAVGAWVNVAIAVLILLSAALFAVQTYTLPHSLRTALNVVDQIILVLFTLEYILRLWSAERPLRFLFSLYGLIDLVAIAPFLLSFTDTRFLRLIRWLRILRLARFFEPKEWSSRLWLNQFNNYQSLILARILFTLFAIIFIYSGGIYQAEHKVNAQAFTTFLDAVYFSVVTMTTVGFGDITPISEAGRGLTIAMIFTGIALIPTQVGDLIQQFVKVRNLSPVVCTNCELKGHEEDAQFCRRCGEDLPQSSSITK